MNLRWRAGLVAAFVLLLGYVTATNFVPEPIRVGSALLPDRGLRLGLDLRGGIHWVIGVELQEAVRHELGYLRDRLEERFQEERLVGLVPRVEGQQLLVAAASAQRARVREFAGDTAVLREVAAVDGALVFEIDEDWQQEVRERAMQQVVEVLRRRIGDPAKGILESVVTRQGNDRVLVQIPGGEVDRESARGLLEVTGFLEFKMVEDQAPSEELLLARHGGVAPEGREVVFEHDRETDRPVVAYLVREQADLTGQYLSDARVGFDNRQRPIVNFTFNPEGGGIFSELTAANIDRQLAIILDERVYSAPVIRSRIGSRGQIEGRFTSQEAADLAVVLRAGSLSVPVVIEEERTVGPALGSDSIRRGLRASLAGLLLVLVFTVLYYGRSGAFASAALATNLVLLIGLMSTFTATLTLPGIAGLVLTVGMAIDANVIIFERIREELRGGKQPRAAVDTGFSKARWTILDANITTLITALVLYEFGTGPIKGFAVTLSIGILTSLFAALVITRTLFDLYFAAAPRPQRLSI